MKRTKGTSLTLMGLLAAAPGLLPVAPAFGAETLREALKETKAMVNWRLRYEGVDQSGFSNDATALTNRLRAGFETGEWGRTSLLGEIVWVEDIVEDFNSTTNGQTQYPVVADPGGISAVNRFALTNKSLEHTALTLGRQRIILDDARFVGNVGWRQNEQTYDGLRSRTDLDAVDVDLAYITQVNRIFGPDSPAGQWNGDIVLANVSHPFSWATVTGFVYDLDLEEAPALSSNTVGVRLTGSKPVKKMAALYTASFARQVDAGANPASYSESYYSLEGGIRVAKLTVALGLEQLGSNGTSAVTTPLATLHAFQGWGDKFLATPAAGMDDRFVRMAYQPGAIGPFESLSIVSVYHDFAAYVGPAHYGDELDLSIVARRQQLSFTIKYAAYDADQLFTDTDKLWVSMDYAF